jgi:hypothetical protein
MAIPVVAEPSQPCGTPNVSSVYEPAAVFVGVTVTWALAGATAARPTTAAVPIATNPRFQPVAIAMSSHSPPNPKRLTAGHHDSLHEAVRRFPLLAHIRRKRNSLDEESGKVLFNAENNSEP